MIKLEDVTLVYGSKPGHTALSGLNLDIGRGESWALIGPSGCGKSSLLFLVAGLFKPQQGRVQVLGEEIDDPRQDVALILQDYGLFPWKSVWENIALGLKLRNYPKQEIAKRVKTLLAALGIENCRDKFPTQLSGGQRQRVAVARALALQPEVLLMDEPFSALDALTREQLQEMVLDIWQQRRPTLVFVTHNIEEAVYLGERIAVFTPQPGRIKTVVDNTAMGSKDYRLTPEFHCQCNKVRHSLEVCR